MSTHDDIAVVAAFLAQTGSALYTLCGTRIYYGRLPTSFDNTQPAIHFQRRSGSRDTYLATAQPDMQFKCYGGSSNIADAETVYRALADKLHAAHNEAVTAGAIVSADETQMGQPITDPETGWPYILTFYQLETRAA
jgi:hypothetical protein